MSTSCGLGRDTVVAGKGLKRLGLACFKLEEPHGHAATGGS